MIMIFVYVKLGNTWCSSRLAEMNLHQSFLNPLNMHMVPVPSFGFLFGLISWDVSPCLCLYCWQSASGRMSDSQVSFYAIAALKCDTPTKWGDGVWRARPICRDDMRFQKYPTTWVFNPQWYLDIFGLIFNCTKVCKCSFEVVTVLW